MRSGKREQWFVARLMFRSLIDDQPVDDALYEERVVLLRSPSVEDASAKAHRYGVREGHEYRNEDGQKVTWIL